jgi:hypothetical protein
MTQSAEARVADYSGPSSMPSRAVSSMATAQIRSQRQRQ